MTGRNDVCPCGSGMKYKKCCLLKVGEIITTEMYYPPVFSDDPVNLGTIKKIPSLEEYNKLKNDEIVYGKYKEIIEDKELSEYLSFTEKDKIHFLKMISTICKHKKRIFEIRIQDTEQFQELVCGQNTKKYASCIYWNEIDQYIHLYRTEVFNLLAERISKIARYFEDINTTAFIARQVMETTANSIANQWVLTTCYNMMFKTINNRNNEVVTWKSLEEFVMSLVMLPKKYVKDLQKVMAKTLDVNFARDYKVPAYDPTTYQQMEICNFVASNILDTAFTCDDDIVSSAKLLKKYYKHLCKFAHPTPMLYEFGYKSVNINKDQKDYFIKGEILKSVYHSLLLYLNLFESSVFYKFTYTDLILNKYAKCNDRIINFVNLESDLIDRVMNNYKDVVISTTEGETVIVKKTSPH
ncbi:SEC-C metal-binding domain-containing protein [Geobacter sulfurreducens]|uniref:SEC-C metal-binding domain-containing protein n=1 Tax=Geobacter sulfurreducens TaxID=35554 RepID=UPI0020B8D931|nr:SEC-C metal-binding domain-containing protein [Geobacter sulfurreducens]UTG94180.1 SEC-C domain-containing protein [Geobacter sulfurreducens]